MVLSKTALEAVHRHFQNGDNKGSCRITTTEDVRRNNKDEMGDAR